MTEEKKAAPENKELTDEEFAELDRNGDGVVHLHEEEIRERYENEPEPVSGKSSAPEVRHLCEEALGLKDAPKSRGGAPENKDAADRDDDRPKPTQLPADPKPIGEGLRPNGRRGGRR